MFGILTVYKFLHLKFLKNQLFYNVNIMCLRNKWRPFGAIICKHFSNNVYVGSRHSPISEKQAQWDLVVPMGRIL